MAKQRYKIQKGEFVVGVRKMKVDDKGQPVRTRNGATIVERSDRTLRQGETIEMEPSVAKPYIRTGQLIGVGDEAKQPARTQGKQGEPTKPPAKS